MRRLSTDAAGPEADWLRRIRAVLSALLGFFDEEPRWARFLILAAAELQPALCSSGANGRYARSRSTGAGDDTRRADQGLARSCARQLCGRADRRRRLFGHSCADARRVGNEPLRELAPALMALDRSRHIRVEARASSCEQHGGRAAIGEIHGSSGCPCAPRIARRACSARSAPRRVLSNREIADAAGLSDEGQTSKLLRRLEQRGLVENVGLGQPYGEANAWLLTAYGERVLDATRHSLVPGAGAVGSRRIRGAA